MMTPLALSPTLRLPPRIARLWLTAGVLFVLVVLGTALAASAQAQAPVSPFGNRQTTGEAYTPPAIFVTAATLAPAPEPGQLAGKFTVLSRQNDVVGDITYRLELLSALPVAADGAVIMEDIPQRYHAVTASEAFALIPNEEKEVSFSYAPPPVPEGDYRVRVQLTTALGRDLGWFDISARLGRAGLTFVDVSAGPIIVPEFPEELLPPTSGPNVTAGSQFTIRATATNPNSQAVTVEPHVHIIPVGDVARAQRVTGEAVTIEPGEQALLELPITAATSPGVFSGELHLHRPGEEASLSPIAAYRWIVRGTSASIVSARLAQLATHQGETAVVAVEYAGPSDAESTARGILTVQLRDEQGELGQLIIPDLELTNAVTGGSARITLNRDLVGSPGLNVVLSDASGAVLDTYEVATPLTREQVDRLVGAAPPVLSTAVIMGLALAVVIAVAVVALLVYRRRQQPLPPLALLLLIGTTLLLATPFVHALGSGNGITVLTPTTSCSIGPAWCPLNHLYTVELFVNAPVHDGPIVDPRRVPFSYRLTWANCTNSVYNARTVVRYAREGGKNSQWREPAGVTYHEIFSQLSPGSCQGYYCQAATTYTAPAGLNLTQLRPGVRDTTLQVMAFWRGDTVAPGAIPDWNGSNYAYYESHQLAHVINLWLNFAGARTSSSPTTAACPTTPTNQDEVVSVSVDPADSWLDGDGSFTLSPNGIVRNGAQTGRGAPHTHLTFAVTVRSGQILSHAVNLLGAGSQDQLPGDWSNVQATSLSLTSDVPRFPTSHCGFATTPGNTIFPLHNGSVSGISWSDGLRSQCGPIHVIGAAWQVTARGSGADSGGSCPTPTVTPTPTCTPDDDDFDDDGRKNNDDDDDDNDGRKDQDDDDDDNDGRRDNEDDDDDNDGRRDRDDDDDGSPCPTPTPPCTPDDDDFDDDGRKNRDDDDDDNDGRRDRYDDDDDNDGRRDWDDDDDDNDGRKDHDDDDDNSSPCPTPTPTPTPQVTPTATPTASPSLPQCSDTQDNDGDGKIDRDDPGCRTRPGDPSTYNPNDPDETDPILSPGPIQETE